MADVPRIALSDRIRTLTLPQAAPFADFIRKGDPGGPIPCWGAIADRFDETFQADDERKALWNVLVEAEDRRPLLLFLHKNRGRPEVMARVLEDAHRLPVSLQRMLVSLDEVQSLVPKHLDRLHQAARQLYEAGPEARKREREQMEVRVSTLLAFRYFVPDRFDPREEGKVAQGSEAPPPDTTGAGTADRIVAPSTPVTDAEPAPVASGGAVADGPSLADGAPGLPAAGASPSPTVVDVSTAPGTVDASPTPTVADASPAPTVVEGAPVPTVVDGGTPSASSVVAPDAVGPGGDPSTGGGG